MTKGSRATVLHGWKPLQLHPRRVAALEYRVRQSLGSSQVGARDGARLDSRPELTNFRTTVPVGTLAAAYAEAGEFSEAIATAEKACHLASEARDATLLQRNQQLLELYRAGKPARE